MSVVLVTGGTGYVGTFCIIEALEKGYKVRTTVRSLAKSEALKNSIVKTSSKLSKEDVDSKLTFVEADLTAEKGWDEAVSGVEYILHVASPFPLGEPKHEDELIIPAREGTLKVLKAADKVGGVKKIVLTSSFAAVGYGHPNHSKVDESWWTNVNNVSGAYVKSKAIAEKAAWDYVKANNSKFALTTVNPTAILGPLVVDSSSVSSSTDIIKTLVSGVGKMGCPKLSFGIIDIRDVAKIHVEALTNKASDGERFLLLSQDQEVSMLQMGHFIKKNITAQDKNLRNLPTRELPNFLIKLAGIFDSSIRGAIPYLGMYTDVSSAKAQKVFNWTPISAEEAIMATYNDLKKTGQV